MLPPNRLIYGWMTLGLLLQPASATEVEARLTWLERVELAPLVSGIVNHIKVQPGSPVRQGQVLLTLDPRPFQARVQAAEAELSRSTEVAAEAQREQDRAQQLYTKMLSSDHDLQTAKLAAAQATAAHKAAQAQLTQAQLEREYSSLKAPFAGIVVAVHAALGQTVISQLQPTPLLIVARTDVLLAQAAVPAAQLEGLQVGQSLPLRWGQQQLKAQIRYLGLEPVAPADHYRLEAQVAVPEGVTPRVGGIVSLELP